MTYNQITEDMKAALKNGDKLRKQVLSNLMAAAKKAAIDNKIRGDIPDSLVDEVILKEKKTLQEQIDTCPIERIDLKNIYREKMELLEPYCPKLITDPQVIELDIKMQLAAAGIEPVKSNRGAVMKIVMPQFKGKADMKVVNQVVGEMLQ